MGQGLLYEKLYRWRRLVALLLLLLLVGGAVGVYLTSRSEEETAVSQVASTATEQKIAIEPTATAEPTATSVPEPTETPGPTATSIPEPTETPEPTATPVPTVIPEPTPAVTTYVVKYGDYLWKIAREMYDDPLRWIEIYEANKDLIYNPNVIRTGWELRIP